MCGHGDNPDRWTRKCRAFESAIIRYTWKTVSVDNTKEWVMVDEAGEDHQESADRGIIWHTMNFCLYPVKNGVF